MGGRHQGLRRDSGIIKQAEQLMITHEQNAALTGVSRGRPLHNFLARFWYPVLKASDLKDRCTRKARLLGENFVVARKGEQLVALDESCPHRMTSLALARVEDGGLRCIYHGWLIDFKGRVAEAPNEREVGGRQQIKVRTPLVREAGGLIWMNICEDDGERAPFPDLPWFHLPANQVVVVNAYCHSNWVQSLEGAIDSSHSSHLHSDEIVSKKAAEASTAVGAGVSLQLIRPSTDRHPRIKVKDTDFGFVYGAIRTPTVDADSQVYIRTSAFAFPCYVTFPSADTLGDLQIFVPIDETHTHFFYIRYSTHDSLEGLGLPDWSGMLPDRDIDEHGYLRSSSMPNWGQDRAAMSAGESFTGIKGVNRQDIVVQESMGTIVDRTREHLGAADLAIVHFRRLLLRATQGEGAAEPQFASAISYNGLKARDGLQSIEKDWSDLYAPGEINWVAAH